MCNTCNEDFIGETECSEITWKHPLDETHLCRGKGAYLTKRFQPVHQQEELVGAMLLRLSRTNGSPLCLCQRLNSKWKNLN